MRRILFLTLLSFNVLFGLEFSDVYARATAPNTKNSAIYMTIFNDKNVDIKIDEISCDASEIAEFHTHIEVDGMKRMQKMENPTIKAQDSLILEPGADHIMLLNISKALKFGDTINLRMRANGETFDINIPIK